MPLGGKRVRSSGQSPGRKGQQDRVLGPQPTTSGPESIPRHSYHHTGGVPAGRGLTLPTGARRRIVPPKAAGRQREMYTSHYKMTTPVVVPGLHAVVPLRRPGSRPPGPTLSTSCHTDTVVRARIDSDTKARATEALKAMGLSVSDVIRMVLLRVADEKRLPFTVQVPNPTTVRAMKELDDGMGQRFDSAEELFRDLDI